MVQPLTIINADVWNGTRFERRDLYTSDVILDKPARNAITVDLSGYWIQPGLINAHDHLELNHFPRTKFRERYDNAHQWGEDVNAHLNDEPFKTLRSYPLEDRCFIGGLKNLLCGATTVIHHNPPHKSLFHKNFPVRVIKRYGWAHSLHFNTDEEVVASYQRTPPDTPWFIHLAEGTDEIAAGEYRRLKKLGCVGANTVIIHGVGMTDEDIADAAPRIRGLVACPSTNVYLLGRSIDASKWLDAGARIAIGSDSRLTAEDNYYREFEYVAFHAGFPLSQDIRLQAFHHAAPILLKQSNALQAGDFADWGAYEAPGYPEAIVVGGIPQVGTPETMARFPHVTTVQGTYRYLKISVNINLARQIARCSLKEPGLELLEHPQGRRRTLW